MLTAVSGSSRMLRRIQGGTGRDKRRSHPFKMMVFTPSTSDRYSISYLLPMILSSFYFLLLIDNIFILLPPTDNTTSTTTTTTTTTTITILIGVVTTIKMKAGSLATAIAAFLLGVSAGRFRASSRGRPIRGEDSSLMTRSSLGRRPGVDISSRNDQRVMGDVTRWRQDYSEVARQPSPVHVSSFSRQMNLPGGGGVTIG